jgi:hypothetical protein|tara:strand:+ start:642 stop:1115 length:474 start_codon:yes stop_codon:yes gene_type:complete
MKFTVSTSNVEYMKKRIAKKLSHLKTDKFVTVGIHSDAGTHEGSGLTNAALGATLNYGTKNIPASPWLEPGVNSGLKEYSKLIKNDIKDKKPLSLILERLGLMASSKVQAYMNDLKTPANAPSTIKIKGFDNRLINTGELKNTVISKVVDNKPSEGI